MKVSLHEESVKVPLIIKVPGKQTQICHSFVELIDLYPTLAELANLETSKFIQGESLKRTFDNPSYSVRNMAFAVSQQGESFLLRDAKFAFIQYNEDASAGTELYDMLNDPKQYHNLANEPKYSNIVKQFQKELKKKLKKVRKNDLGINYKN